MSERIEPQLPANLRAAKTRTITHITAGNPDWEPTQDQLDRLKKDFQEAELTGILATRSSVRVHNLEIVVPEDIEIAESEVLAAALAWAGDDSTKNHDWLRDASRELKKLREEQIAPA